METAKIPYSHLERLFSSGEPFVTDAFDPGLSMFRFLTFSSHRVVAVAWKVRITISYCLLLIS